MNVVIFALEHIPIGDWVEDTLVPWLNDNFGWLFDWIKERATSLNDQLTTLLSWPTPLIFAIILAFIAWRVRGWMMAVFTFFGLLLIDNLGYWDHAMMTLALVLISALVAVAIGVPTGIIGARSKTFSAIVRPQLDFMQTMPAFVYLIPAVTFFRIGVVPGMVATVIFSMPPAVRLTELGIRQVDEEVVEAGQAFGASPSRILFKIQLPLARPTIMAGVNQVIMLALSMVVIAGMIGAPGLGSDVYGAVTRVRIGTGFEAGLCVVIIAVILDRLTSAFGSDAQSTKPSLFARVRGMLSKETAEPTDANANANGQSATNSTNQTAGV
ncbi:MAG TPA: proline/glycine betaine ABC transporter permease [Acidimicrobiales bacterium]|nr:proline/glycine betaine ABC transporter permease [Acidimicrobiales bacterium]